MNVNFSLTGRKMATNTLTHARNLRANFSFPSDYGLSIVLIMCIVVTAIKVNLPKVICLVRWRFTVLQTKRILKKFTTLTYFKYWCFALVFWKFSFHPRVSDTVMNEVVFAGGWCFNFSVIASWCVEKDCWALLQFTCLQNRRCLYWRYDTHWIAVFFFKPIAVAPSFFCILDFAHFDSRQKFSNFKPIVITVNHLNINWFIQYANWLFSLPTVLLSLHVAVSFSPFEVSASACSCVAELCTRVGETFLWGQWIPVALLYLAHVLRTLCFFYCLLMDEPLSHSAHRQLWIDDKIWLIFSFTTVHFPFTVLLPSRSFAMLKLLIWLQFANWLVLLNWFYRLF